MRRGAAVALLLALGGCSGSSVERPDTPTLYRSSRHVNVVVSRGGRTVYIGGQGAFDASGGLIGPGDFGLQVETAFRNLEAALQAAGASLRHVVQLRTYLVDDPAVDLSVYRKARDRRWEGIPERPAATTVTVSGTTVPGALILLEAVAVLPD